MWNSEWVKCHPNWNQVHKSSKRTNYRPQAAEKHCSMLHVAVSPKLSTAQFFSKKQISFLGWMDGWRAGFLYTCPKQISLVGLWLILVTALQKNMRNKTTSTWKPETEGKLKKWDLFNLEKTLLGLSCLNLVNLPVLKNKGHLLFKSLLRGKQAFPVQEPLEWFRTVQEFPSLTTRS